MYGAAVSCLYEGLLGLSVVTPNECYEIKPFIPNGVNYYEVKVPIVKGAIYCKAENKYGKKTVTLSVPFGINIRFNNMVLKTGFHCFEIPNM